jgi:hypothetical protein
MHCHRNSHTVGGVVSPAQQLMMIVPRGSSIEVEAMISNRDIGFVEAGQDAEIKIDTFNFTRYGLLHGKVTSISRDAIVKDKPQDRTGASKQGGALSESSEPAGQELLYTTRVSLEDTVTRNPVRRSEPSSCDRPMTGEGAETHRRSAGLVRLQPAQQKARAGECRPAPFRSDDGAATQPRDQPLAGLCGQTIVRLSSFGVLLLPS